MGYIGSKPADKALTSDDIADSIITSAKIADGTIASADLASGVGGKVLQVVTSSYATETSNTSSTYADTGLSASITPSSTSSKILVTVHQTGLGKEVNNTYGQLKLLRGATDLAAIDNSYAYTNSTSPAQNRVGGASIVYLDSPATTSSTTYKTQFASGANVSQVIVQQNSSTSTICLMEIAG